MASTRKGGKGEALTPTGRLVFDSGLVSLDDPRITPLREGYEDLALRLFRSANGAPASAAGAHRPK
jgi:hypothetical protein